MYTQTPSPSWKSSVHVHKLCHYVVCSHLQQSHLHLFQSTYIQHIITTHVPLCSPDLLTLPCQTNGWVLTSVLRPCPEPEPGLMLSHPLRPVLVSTACARWRIPHGDPCKGDNETVGGCESAFPVDACNIRPEAGWNGGRVGVQKSVFFFLPLTLVYVRLALSVYNVAMSVWGKR